MAPWQARQRVGARALGWNVKCSESGKLRRSSPGSGGKSQTQGPGLHLEEEGAPPGLGDSGRWSGKPRAHQAWSSLTVLREPPQFL